MNSPNTSVVVAGAVRSAAQLVVMLFVVVRAHVKDGVQTACRHNLNFVHFRCIILQSPEKSRTPKRMRLMSKHLKPKSIIVVLITTMAQECGHYTTQETAKAAQDLKKPLPMPISLPSIQWIATQNDSCARAKVTLVSG